MIGFLSRRSGGCLRLLGCDFCWGETIGFLSRRRPSCQSLGCGLWLVNAIKDINQMREKQNTGDTHYGANGPQQDSRPFHAVASLLAT